MPTQSKLVSIVLPVWNGQKFLGSAIESVLSQTYKNFELIIVNDCSSDATASIMKSFDDPRIFSIHNSENLKLPASLNIGFRAAKGNYLTWISDDNIFKPFFLELLVEEMMKGFDFVYSNYDVIDEKNIFVYSATTGPTENLMIENVIGASFMYTRELMENIGLYDTNKFMYEDYDYWVRAFASGFKFSKLEISPYEYRIHKNQLSVTRELPSEYPMYRYKNLSKVTTNDKALMAKAYLSILGLAIRNQNLKVAILSLSSMFVRFPFESCKLFIKRICDLL